ncbi:phosphatase PAP2 family protein [Duganella sp. FT80W]|uniref:Phosphatase PAP2 family protein n=1 Tax=Duganella guangzhouensis TaxID=2666084 RepID=A0A6I2KXE2_9BURK|nr:phosphatase PAP2 family protein [Duganella guangzhouensis]MRW90433.1 phosphatase PAP2 family protein [Duganella guangzhouensis]
MQLPTRPHLLALSIALALTACGSNIEDEPLVIPAAPADQGAAETVAVPSATAFVDTVATNQRGDARYATLATNAGVRVLGGFLDIWKPLTQIVDAGVTAPAVDSFPAVVASTWTGVPGDGTPDGTIANSTVHQANINYVINATTNRTADQAVQAYLDDRRGKGYSVTDGLGPLTNAWRTAAQQTTSITSVASDATTVLYNDSGNNTGVGSTTNTTFGNVVDLVNLVGNNASTEPAKRFYKYARPYRWSSSVVLLPTLVPAKSTTPATDGGFPSGHTAEAVRDTIAMAYALPERYQEILSRGLELGEMRIIAGMHSPTDVIGGRILGTATAAANLYDSTNAAKKAAAVTQAHTALIAATGTTADTFAAYAQSGTTATDRFADYATNKTNYSRRLTFGFAQIASTTATAVVPKGAEVLLETRQPYLSDAQRRVVLKTTALASGYPVSDDSEGWGRLNLFAAADGYGAFSGNVTIAMDASKGGFNAADRWRNNISGSGKLIKQGTGTLKLAGANTWTGGTELTAGTLTGESTAAFGAGDVYNSGGTLVSNASSAVKLAGKYTQLSGSTVLELDVGGAAAGSQGTLTVAGTATIAGGTLRIKFASGYAPKAGTVLTVLTAGSLKGRFTTVSVDGFSSVTATYGATTLTLTLG